MIKRRHQVGRAYRRGVGHTTPLSDLRSTKRPRGKSAEPSDDAADETAEVVARRRSAARHTAIGLLARREHAQSEVRRKLQERGYDADLTGEVVDELTRQRLLSDERFAESFIRARADRGQGPVRLRAELWQLRLSPELIARHLAAIQVDWAQSAITVRTRRFGNKPPRGLAERAKQVRFLQYRGFTADQIRAALRQASVTDEVDELLVADDADSPDDYSED